MKELCKDLCTKYPDCLKYKLVKNQKDFVGEVEVCENPSKRSDNSDFTAKAQTVLKCPECRLTQPTMMDCSGCIINAVRTAS